MIDIIVTIGGMYDLLFFFFQAEDGIRDIGVTGVQTCALPICPNGSAASESGGAAGRQALSVVQPANAEMEAALPLGPHYAGRQDEGRRGHGPGRSEERRVGKEGRSRWSPYH